MLIGEISALLAAAAFSVTSVCYTLAGRKINAQTAIAMSLPTALLFMLGIHQVALGELVPTGASLERWTLLGASGILAYVISNWFMLNAYQFIGPRLTMLIASFAPLLGALLAWLALGQRLPPNSALGIALVTVGVVWVVGERQRAKPTASQNSSPYSTPDSAPEQPVAIRAVSAAASADAPAPNRRRGVLYAGLGTLAQAAAFVFSAQGAAGGFPPYSATLIRILAGAVVLWAFIAWQGRLRSTAIIFRGDARLFWQLTGAAISGPIVAGTLILLSFQYIPVGVTTTLSHTTSVMLIPVGYFLFREHITLRTILGTLVTVAGIGLLFIW